MNDTYDHWCMLALAFFATDHPVCGGLALVPPVAGAMYWRLYRRRRQR